MTVRLRARAVQKDEDLADLIPPETASVVALFDNPVGFFTWDLMEAFPDYEVVLTVRDVRRVLVGVGAGTGALHVCVGGCVGTLHCM